MSAPAAAGSSAVKRVLNWPYEEALGFVVVIVLADRRRVRAAHRRHRNALMLLAVFVALVVGAAVMIGRRLRRARR